MISEIHLFDFDGTLFRTPLPPEGWPDGDWWPNPASMKPPYVPDKPGSAWWIPEPVTALKAAIANPRAYTAVCTARMYPLRSRLNELLNGRGLRPDDLILNDSDFGAARYKMQEMKYLTRQFPTANAIHFWEDNGDHLRQFHRYAEQKLHKAFVPHLVRSKRVPATPVSAGRVASRYLDR